MNLQQVIQLNASAKGCTAIVTESQDHAAQVLWNVLLPVPPEEHPGDRDEQPAAYGYKDAFKV